MPYTTGFDHHVELDRAPCDLERMIQRRPAGARVLQPGERQGEDPGGDQRWGGLAGFALLSLALVCWPTVQAEGRTGAAVRAMLITICSQTIYLLHVGITGDLVGKLLWPAVAYHALATPCWGATGSAIGGAGA